ncbi:MAG: MFS transporter [Proteobacteria bacterium]|nr:MFS transporter [Pseudomonadota bacterium]
MLTTQQKIGYAIGAYGLILFWSGASLFMLYYYTDVLLIKPETAGLIFLLAMIWDGITDPVMGMIADRTRTRWGQYRPYLLFGAIPLAISYYLAFSIPELSAEALVTYVLITHLLFRTCFTVVYMPFTAFIAKLTSDSNERSSLTGYKVIFTQLATLSVSFFTLRLVDWFGGGNDATGFRMVALLSGVIGVLFIFACYRGTSQELLQDRKGQPPTYYSVSDLLLSFKANYPFVLVFLGTFLFVMSYAMILKGVVYYAKYYIGDKQMIGTILSLVAAMALLVVPVCIKLTTIMSKRFIWIMSGLFTITGLVIVYLMPPTAITGIVIGYIVLAIGTNAFLMNYYSMLADTVEYGEWKTGVRCEAGLFGFVAFAQKASVGVGASLIGFLLGHFGFIANTIQTPETLQGIKLSVTLIPCLGILASMFLMIFYPINAALHKKMSEEIAARNNDAGRR